MAIDWLWKAKESSGVAPAIRDQYIAMGQNVLCLRNPMIADSCISGKLFAASIVIMTALCLWMYWALWVDSSLDWGLIFPTLVPVSLCFFLAYRIHLIKYQTHFYFNRHTQKVYYRKGKLLQIGDWDKVQAGMSTHIEFTGRAFSVVYSLVLNVFGTDPQSEQYRLIRKSWAPAFNIVIDSNEPTVFHTDFIAEVWEYICCFMEEGPESLPAPQELNWWNLPQNSICLTPSQALRHYVPWRTGEPGEEQGKSMLLLPLFFILFPYNLLLALCWWATCRLFRVRAGEPPDAVFEGETVPISERMKGL